MAMRDSEMLTGLELHLVLVCALHTRDAPLSSCVPHAIGTPLTSCSISPATLGKDAAGFRRILLPAPINSVMYFLSTTGGVVPVDSGLERD
jgi:hypothetical protein